MVFSDLNFVTKYHDFAENWFKTTKFEQKSVNYRSKNKNNCSDSNSKLNSRYFYAEFYNGKMKENIKVAIRIRPLDDENLNQIPNIVSNEARSEIT